MRTVKKQLKPRRFVLLIGCWVFAMPVIAATDFEARENLAKARVKHLQKDNDHALHESHVDESQIFRGVFYGYLPCNDCNGIKVTLSLKQKNNYLMVTQPARESSREYYEKGKYSWNEESQIVVLTPRKGVGNTRRYFIENDGTLVQLDDDGTRLDKKSDRYVLRRSDKVKSREVHIH
ncbi:copper resistance protein NlpE [Methylotuvimicrobium buryatense]|uniref:Copper resistance protein NlpE n=1 Tax=Methylotuvimicrobium buryatense TaxID=95641 RepID=A0A4P9UJ73_METBY|nr:copper resistance protein NlpE [Methylotuvimicrobium buryatense]QCW81212.1 copper resistance protein NlpE [Methylotuvimicrobium buryatense]